MSIARLSVSWKAGAKVAHISIQSKYIDHFFTSFLKLICNSLIDKDVVEHIFERRYGWARKDIHYIYTCARRARRKRIKTFYKHAGLGGGGSVSIVAASKQGHCFTHSSGSISPLWFRSGYKPQNVS